MVEFISYTGEYPNLCRGVLTVMINNKEVRFGHDYSKFNSWKTDGNYESFWMSGGGVWFTDDYAEAHVDSAPWVLDEMSLPDEFKSIGKELINCFNENVIEGCCGGCI